MVSSDTDNDIIISSVLSIAAILYRSRQVNVRKHKRNSWTREWITAQHQSKTVTKNGNGFYPEITFVTCKKLGNLPNQNLTLLHNSVAL